MIFPLQLFLDETAVSTSLVINGGISITVGTVCYKSDALLPAKCCSNTADAGGLDIMAL